MMLPIAYVTNWMKHSAGGILTYVGIFIVIFLIAWLIQYHAQKGRIQKMNDCIRKKRSEG